MALVTCPGCGREIELQRFRRDAEEFCTSCDFPLFFTSSVLVDDSELEHWQTPVGAAIPVRRRLPGAGGRDDLVGEACPVCAELNLPGADFCHRCGSPMHPVAEPEPESVPQPERVVVEPTPVPEPAERFPTVPVLVTALLIVVVLLVSGAVVVHYWP